MWAGTEELKGQGCVSLVVKALVVQEVGGTEKDGVTRCGLPQKEDGGQTGGWVADGRVETVRCVADAARLDGSGSQGRRHGTAGGTCHHGGGGLGADAGGQCAHGAGDRTEENGAAGRGGGGCAQGGLVVRCQQVGSGDEERGVGSGCGGGVLKRGDDADGYAVILEEFRDGPAAVAVRRAGVQAPVLLRGAGAGQGYRRDDEQEDGQQHPRARSQTWREVTEDEVGGADIEVIRQPARACRPGAVWRTGGRGPGRAGADTSTGRRCGRRM